MNDPRKSSADFGEMSESGANDHLPQQPTFTTLTVHGCNIQGLVNFLMFVGVLLLTLQCDNRRVGTVLFSVGICGCCAVDLTSRLVLGKGKLISRLVSPNSGGAFILVPSWALYPSMFIIIPVVVAIARWLK
jgi:hypothetical protein